ncbi:MAG: hypothetical protein ACI8Q1_000250 [Parvicella sp.]|jgi:hypothetical protein
MKPKKDPNTTLLDTRIWKYVCINTHYPFCKYKQGEVIENYSEDEEIEFDKHHFYFEARTKHYEVLEVNNEGAIIKVRRLKDQLIFQLTDVVEWQLSSMKKPASCGITGFTEMPNGNLYFLTGNKELVGGINLFTVPKR